MDKMEDLLKKRYDWSIEVYSYQDKGITIRSNDIFTLNYLSLYLTAFLEKKEIQNMDAWEIRVIVENVMHEYMRQYVSDANGDYIVFEEATGCITIENPKLKKRWHIARKDQNNLGFVQDIYCWIRRTLIQQISANESVVLLHGACVSFHGVACLVLGEKRLGKSYLTNHLMFKKHWSYVAADQTIVTGKEDGTIYARGNITSYRMEEKDFDLYEKEACRELIYFRQDDRYVHKNGKINLPPAFLETYFHVSSTQDVILKHVIILSKQKYDLERMQEEKRIELVTKYVLHDSVENSTSKNTQNHSDKKNLVRAIVKNCNVVSFSSGFSFEMLYDCLMHQKV